MPPSELMGAADGESSAVVAARVRCGAARHEHRQGVTNVEVAVAAWSATADSTPRSHVLLQRPPSAWAGQGAACTGC